MKPAGALAAATIAALLIAVPGRASAQVQAATPAACAVLDIEDLIAQAQNQFTAGFPRSALALTVRALACSQDGRLYRMAAMYACAARDAVSAQLYFSKIPAESRPIVAQRCLAASIVLAPAGAASAPSGSAQLKVAVAAPHGTAAPRGMHCDMSRVDDLMYDAADQFIAGDAKGALSLASIALACKRDARTLRMAAIYACVAHDDIAQLYYIELPPASRGAIRQRCRQEGIELRDAIPAAVTRSAAPAAAVGQAACASVHADELVDQAAQQFSAGFSRAALALIMKALNCQQNVRMFRAATTYACATRDLDSAKRYFAQVPAAFQAQLIQRCRMEGLELVAP